MRSLQDVCHIVAEALESSRGGEETHQHPIWFQNRKGDRCAGVLIWLLLRKEVRTACCESDADEEQRLHKGCRKAVKLDKER